MSCCISMARNLWPSVRKVRGSLTVQGLEDVVKGNHGGLWRETGPQIQWGEDCWQRRAGSWQHVETVCHPKPPEASTLFTLVSCELMEKEVGSKPWSHRSGGSRELDKARQWGYVLRGTGREEQASLLGLLEITGRGLNEPNYLKVQEDLAVSAKLALNIPVMRF